MNENEGGFWAHAFDDLGDNLSILGAVAEDVVDNANPWSEEFLSGEAKNTATEVERQLAADEGREVDQGRIDRSSAGGLELVSVAITETGSDVKAAAGSAVSTVGSAAGGVLDAITNPWVLGTVGVLVLAILAAPYVIPAFKAAT